MQSILLLPGWRVQSTRYFELKSEFEKLGYRVFAIDFPGFNGNDIPVDGYTLEYYANYLKSYIHKKKLTNLVIVAHSFGGRVIVRYLHDNKINSINGVILTGTPLIKDKLTIRKQFGKVVISFSKTFLPAHAHKFLRKNLRFILYKFIGEYDYYKSGSLQKTLVNVLSDDPQKYIEDVLTPTLIIWGENDTITPSNIAKALHLRIKNSQLVMISSATHGLPFDKPKIFVQHCVDFIKSLN